MDKMQYVSAETLASMLTETPLQNNPLVDEVVIFDVRSHDEWEEGHIRGATHVPSSRWSNVDYVAQVANEFCRPLSDGLHADINGSAGGKKKKVVLHCAMSQQRGPTCARVLQSYFARTTSTSTSTASPIDTTAAAATANHVPDIFVLQGGFSNFARRYYNNKLLVVDEPEIEAEG
mmetsp:Transcript_5572/g.9152  ORF Transcript_5572/g.9152 Transcript_5572/m.9152 type:complete len:176 (-) Transcript_5572:63-590(-)